MKVKFGIVFVLCNMDSPKSRGGVGFGALPTVGGWKIRRGTTYPQEEPKFEKVGKKGGNILRVIAYVWMVITCHGSDVTS